MAQASPAASDLASGKVYVASPDTSSSFGFSSTAISGTPITGQDALYSVVTVNYTNNTASVITAAGTGAAAGFGIGGPYGAAAGFLLSAAQAAAGDTNFLSLRSTPQPTTQVPKPDVLGPYICQNESVSLANADIAVGTKTPSAFFPVTISVPATSLPLAPKSQLTAVDLPSTIKSACWHVLPNGGLLGSAQEIDQAASTAPRTKLSAGDGWLYRVVENDGTDPSSAPAGTIPVQNYFNGKSRQDFPYSSCRSATLQITWWQELANAVSASPTKPKPRILPFQVNIADPNYVSPALLTKGGAINFKPDCGANVSSTPDNSTSGILNASVTAAESIYKAEQTWSKGGTSGGSSQ